MDLFGSEFQKLRCISLLRRMFECQDGILHLWVYIVHLHALALVQILSEFFPRPLPSNKAPNLPMVFMLRFPHSGHISMIDDADENLQVVVDFLSRAHEAHQKQQAFVPKDWDETVPIGLANRDGWRSDLKLSTAVALMIVAISSFAAGMLLGRSKARADEYVRML